MAESGPGSTFATCTSTYLLEGLKDPGNATVWRQYVERYRPLLVRYGQRLGLGTEDAEDVAQRALLSFCQAYQAGKYDRDKGRLRNWLFGIARNEIRNWRRRHQQHELQVAGQPDQTDFFAQLGDEDRWEQVWEQEWRHAVMRQCLEEVRREVDPTTFEAFELFASRGWPAARVAKQLGLTANAVFIAKHRILRRIRELLPQMETVW
jgi:RNA polymerase sigma factor (sigma-70 family)